MMMLFLVGLAGLKKEKGTKRLLYGYFTLYRSCLKPLTCIINYQQFTTTALYKTVLWFQQTPLFPYFVLLSF